jgi:hypothetical protein
MSEFTLTKKITARTKTIKFHWIKKDFLVIDERYRMIRSRTSNPMDTCHWCGYKFENGEMMALGSIVGSGNKVFCQKCVEGA